VGTVEPIRQKVAIVGTAPSAVAAPYDDPSFEIWTLNGAWGEARTDRHFQMHAPDREHIRGICGDHYINWLATFPGPVYMQSTVDWVPSSVVFPIEKLAREFPEQWGCTPCYMLALAIHEGFHEIAICGIEMIADSEYRSQREPVQFFVGFALGRGIKVTFPGGSALEKRSIRYGYDHPPEIPDALTAAFKREYALAEERWNVATVALQRAEGARQAFEAMGLAERAKQAEECRTGALTERIKAEGVMAASKRMECTFAHVATGA